VAYLWGILFKHLIITNQRIYWWNCKNLFVCSDVSLAKWQLVRRISYISVLCLSHGRLQESGKIIKSTYQTATNTGPKTTAKYNLAFTNYLYIFTHIISMIITLMHASTRCFTSCFFLPLLPLMFAWACCWFFISYHTKRKPQMLTRCCYAIHKELTTTWLPSKEQPIHV